MPSSLDYDMTDRVMVVIEEYIKRNKLNYSSFGKKIGLDKAYFSNIRTKRQRFKNEHLHSIARITGLNLNYVFGVSRQIYIKETQQPLSEQLSDIAIQVRNLGY